MYIYFLRHHAFALFTYSQFYFKQHKLSHKLSHYEKNCTTIANKMLPL